MAASYFVPTGVYSLGDEECNCPEIPTPTPAADADTPAAAAPDDLGFGVDIDVVTDITRSVRLVGGRRNLGNALARRLSTARGDLFYDANYGTDLRSYLMGDAEAGTLAEIAAAAEGECLKDERVQAASVRATWDAGRETLTLQIEITTAEAPFQLVLRVSDLAVELLEIN